jgi:type II restriction enzyme
MKLTANDIVHAIERLPKNISYNYIHKATSTKIRVVAVHSPDGPILIGRYDPNKKKGQGDEKRESISTEMIWRIANAFSKAVPVNFDRVLGGSYNTRSALEALMAHTPEFYCCFPGRIEILNAKPTIKTGHKHLMWDPDHPHEQGKVCHKDVDMVISEIPTADAIYESIVLGETPTDKVEIELKRRHSQIQIALMKIGLQLGSRIWIAYNDRAIEYEGKKLGETAGVIPRLEDEKLVSQYEEALKAARLIDVIWFKNAKHMPAVFEIEHSTGVVTGLSRMKTFKDGIPEFPTRWVIVAPDELRNKVIAEANKDQFKPLKTFYFPYSAVEELYSLCQRRNITGVDDEFLVSFMVPCLN